MCFVLNFDTLIKQKRIFFLSFVFDTELFEILFVFEKLFFFVLIEVHHQSDREKKRRKKEKKNDERTKKFTNKNN